MRRFPVLVFAAFLGACSADVDGESDGDVLRDSSYAAIDYALTSDNYKKWVAAQQALDSAGIRPIERIDVRSVSDDDIDRVTGSLESQPPARAAIESAGLSVRDFVLTTIALAQSWDAVNGPSARVLGVRPENLEFLRTQAVGDSIVRARPGAAWIDDSPSAGGADSDDDSDSERGHGIGKGRNKNKNKGKHGRG